MSTEDKKPYAVIGAGGHAAVVKDLLSARGHNVVAMIDREDVSQDRLFEGVSRMEVDEFLSDYTPDQVDLALGIGTIEPLGRRGGRLPSVLQPFLDKGFRFPCLIHPFSYVAACVKFGEGVQVHAGAVVQAGSEVEDFSILNTGCRVDHDAKIGRYCHIAPGVVLSGGVVIGDGGLLGTGCSVVQQIQIGEGVLIAAGATVISDVGHGKRMQGVPAKPYPYNEESHC